MKVVSGSYKQEAELTDAVKQLQQRSVPADAIRVVVHRADGEDKEVPVALESRVLQGAKLGALIGAVLGAGGLTLVSAGIIPSPGLSLLASDPVMSAVRGALAGGAVGGGIGSLQGMGRFFSRPYVDTKALEKGSATVEVRSDELAEAARSVLEATGAEDIRVEEESQEVR